MAISQLKTLVKRGESDVLEFKSSTANLTAGMQTVCAFLNSLRGGTIIFGVKDDGQIIGQEVEIGGSFSITLPLREPIVSTMATTRSALKLTSRQQEIINILKNGPLSRKQIISAMQNPPAERTVQMELNTLYNLKLIVPEGKARAIVWSIVHS